MAIILIITIGLLTLWLATSSYWMVVCTYRIYLYKRYQRAAARHLPTSEESGTFEEYHYLFETEIYKNIFFILINFCEVYGSVLAFFGLLFYESYIQIPGLERNAHYRVMLLNCRSVNSSTLNEFQLKQINIVKNVIGALMDVLELLVVLLGVWMMSYLTRRIKQFQYPSKKLKFVVLLYLHSL